MKVANVVQTAINTATNEDALEMSIDAASSVFLMDALGKLYSQPARAALREYLSNAVDAHIEAGGSRPPVEVTLPDFSTEMLSIRDYGNGMSEKTFNEVVSRYGASTKRNSNAVQGGFGLGAKAGFAIADEFFMTSYQKGKLVKVRIFKNENSKSYLEVVERSNTAEPDGLLVEVPIPRDSRRELSFNLLSGDNFFEAYAASEITIREGLHDDDNLKSKSVFDDSFTPLEFGGVIVGWISNEPNYANIYSVTRAIIGRVSYAVASHYNSSEYEDILHESGYEVVLNIPIGSVDLPSAREELTYSERSRKTISALAATVLRLIEEKVQKEINAIDSRFDVITRMASLHADRCPGMSKMTWRGEAVPMKFSPDRATANFDCDDSAILFEKAAKGRPSLTVTDIGSVSPHVFLKSVSDTDNYSTVFVEVDGADALKAAQKKINAGITDYRKSLSINKGTAQVMLLRSDMELAKWFKHDNLITLEEFNSVVRGYRALARQATALPSSTSYSDAVEVTIAPSRRIQWIGLDAESLKASSFNTGDAEALISENENCYYLALDEIKEVSDVLHSRFKDMLKTPADYWMPEYARTGFKSFGSVLGEDAKLLFLASGRSTDVFKKNNPGAKPLAPALRAGVDKAWEEVKAGKYDALNIFATEFNSTPKRHCAESMLKFMNTLSEEELLTLDPAILEIGVLMEPSLRDNSYGNLLIETFNRSEKREVSAWMGEKVSALSARYPVLAHVQSYESAVWTNMKPHLYEYVTNH